MNTLTLTTSQVQKITTLTPVNAELLKTVPESLKAVTEDILKCGQLHTGVSLTLCERLYTARANTAALKASPYKTFGNYASALARLDPAQATRYANMYEKLFVDINKDNAVEKEVAEKLAKEVYTTAQLVAMSTCNDRVIRNQLILRITPKHPSTNINKAVKYLKSNSGSRTEYKDGQLIQILAVDWETVISILDTGKLPEATNNTTDDNTTDNTTGDNTTDNTTDNNTGDNTTDNTKSIEFTIPEEAAKWLTDNANNIQFVKMVIQYVD